jgi:hypothetical protein
MKTALWIFGGAFALLGIGYLCYEKGVSDGLEEAKDVMKRLSEFEERMNRSMKAADEALRRAAESVERDLHERLGILPHLQIVPGGKKDTN